MCFLLCFLFACYYLPQFEYIIAPSFFIDFILRISAFIMSVCFFRMAFASFSYLYYHLPLYYCFLFGFLWLVFLKSFILHLLLNFINLCHSLFNALRLVICYNFISFALFSPSVHTFPSPWLAQVPSSGKFFF